MLIRMRTRLGAGVKGNLKSLAESTIKARERYASNLSSETSPSESNLTATGQLLDAIVGEIKESGKIIFTVNRKKRKKELSGKSSKLTNEQVRQYVEEGGREFLALSDEERKEAIALASEIIKGKFKQAFK